jgi:sirohydrochlorin ferrochelatase
MPTDKHDAIILLGHGSRVQDAGKQMEEVSSLLKRKYGLPVVETCYMSRLGPHLQAVLETVVSGGAKRVIVIPYFLHGGLHILLDIPEMLQEEARKYPEVSIVFGANLGFDELLVDLVHKRIQQSQTMVDVRQLTLPPREHFPIPEGQCEFVPMKPEEAEAYRRREGGEHHR